jgi:hypothetical protein
MRHELLSYQGHEYTELSSVRLILQVSSNAYVDGNMYETEKYIPIYIYTHRHMYTTVEELWEAVFSVGSIPRLYN